jgi:peroxiredoxin
LRRDYSKIQRAGAELVLITPDTPEEHRKYTRALFGEDPPYRYVADMDFEIAHQYSLLRSVEHPHGGFYYRSLWLLNREGVITHKSLPWTANLELDEYQRLFALIGSEPGEWIATCGPEEAIGNRLPVSGL